MGEKIFKDICMYIFGNLGNLYIFSPLNGFITPTLGLPNSGNLLATFGNLQKIKWRHYARLPGCQNFILLRVLRSI